ncbi:MAG: Fibronectin type protein [Actinomycetota bacterium]|nr:Fibronectin type protein [Actinomycetota bacterium]
MWRSACGAGIAAVTAIAAVALGAPPAFAAGQTFTVTSPALCGGAGTFQQAVKDANASPGKDTIVFTAGMTAGTSSCASIQSAEEFLIVATEAVDIVGNGAKIVGPMYWVDPQGRVNNFQQCPVRTAGSNWLQKAKGVLAIGEFGQDNTGVDVTMSGLSFDNLPELFQAYEKASFTLADSSATNIMSFNEQCERGAIEGWNGANITLRNVSITESYAPGMSTDEGSRDALISGSGGNLVLDRVILGNNWQSQAVSWEQGSGAGSVKIVSSKIIESGGLRLDAANSQIVNSAFFSQGQHPTDRIVTNAGATTIKASSFYWTRPTCEGTSCGVNGMGFWSPITGTFAFQTTAIGANASFPNSGPVLFGDITKFTSDTLTWVQQTANQPNAEIKAILPNAMTTFPGLDPTGGGLSWVDFVTPMLGVEQAPGVLIDAVPDALCPGGANALLNPIDGSCLTQDVLGKPRWDAGNGTRNIGAVQTVQSPTLSIDTSKAITETTVPLMWNRPEDPASGPIVGYNVNYAPATGGPLQVFYVPGAGNLTATIPGLTPGTPYAFTVSAVNQYEPGPRSNVVTATPVGEIDPPVVTATPGSHEVRLFWTEPPLRGHPGPLSYYVVFRKVGEQVWTNGPAALSARTTVITELINGVEYEFGVVATSPDQSHSPVVAAATATPTGGTGASVFVPIDPARVYDTRRAGPGGTPNPIPGNLGSRVMQVADAIDIVTGQVVQKNVVPAGATAVAFNLTATNTHDRGWFSIAPGDAGTYAASTVNWPGGQDVIANGLTVKVAADRTVKVFNGAGQPTDAVLDIVGYFLPPGATGDVFHELTPTRVYDSRVAGPGGTPDPVPGAGSRVVSMANGIVPPTPDVVPVGATAVAYNISAVDTSARGWFAVTPGNAVTYRSSTINWPGAGDVIDNGQFGMVDANRQIKIFNGSTRATNVVVEVLGYFTPDATAVDGSYFHPLDPVRAYDSRVPTPDPGPLAGGATRNVSVANGRSITTGAITVPDVIPVGAGSIAYNVTATNTTSRGWFSVTPGDVNNQVTSSINWPRGNDVVANGLTVAIDDQRTINVRSGSPSQTDLVIDLYGYFR